MSDFGQIANSKFEEVFGALRLRSVKKDPVLKEAAKREMLESFVAAVGSWKNLEELVEQKFSCKWNELTARRQKTYSAVVLLSQKISPENVSRQISMPLNTVRGWHSIYISKGFTGVKQHLNSVGRKAA